MSRAFEGIKVVDFTQVISGPTTTFQLALLGAQVIKVEPPDTGDMCRSFLDPDMFGGGMMSPAFIGLNLNKRSLAIDLKHEGALEALRPLIEDADVVIENFRPGVMARLGLDYDAVKAIRPDIIYCSVSGYGQSGPRKASLAYDGAVQAASGMMACNGHEETGPTRTGAPLVDVVSGLMAAFAISSALYRRLATGEGQFLDVAMLDTTVTMLNPLYNLFLATGREPELLGNQSVTQHPTANVFPTADGHLQITSLTQEQTERLFSALEESSALDDPRFTTPEARILHKQLVREIVIKALSRKGTAEWLEIFSAAKVPVAPVATFPEVMADLYLRDRVLTEAMPVHPSVASANMVCVTTGFQAGGDGPKAEFTAPMLGEHSREILLEYGFDNDAISAWEAAGVIRDAASIGR